MSADLHHEAMDDMAAFGQELNQREGWHRIGACSGPCGQGDGKCPHPQACQLPERTVERVSGAFTVPFWCFLGALFAFLAFAHFGSHLAEVLGA